MMKYPRAEWEKHPGRNPQFDPDPRWQMAGVSRWLPHQGKKEMARRVRQAA